MPQTERPAYLTRSMAHPSGPRRYGAGSVKLTDSSRNLPVVYLNTGGNLYQRIEQANAKFKRLMRSGDKAAALAASRECSALERELLRAVGVR